MPQEFDYFILMPTVREELELSAEAGLLSRSGVADAGSVWEEVARVSEGLGIGGLMGRRVSSLSTGERQRVALASALSLKPDILLLDEPLAHQDDAGIGQAVSLIRELSGMVKLILIAEHRLERLLAAVDRVIIFERGRVVFEGDPGEALELLGRTMDPTLLSKDKDVACLSWCREAISNG